MYEKLSMNGFVGEYKSLLCPGESTINEYMGHILDVLFDNNNDKAIN